MLCTIAISIHPVCLFLPPPICPICLLSNPNNEWLDRQDLATEVLGFAHGQAIHQTFKAAELDEIEAEALGMRRKQYAKHSVKIDKSLIDKAKEGKTRAAKLYYQRLEGWAEKQDHRVSGEINVVLQMPEPDPPEEDERGRPNGYVCG